MMKIKNNWLRSHELAYGKEVKYVFGSERKFEGRKQDTCYRLILFEDGEERHVEEQENHKLIGKYDGINGYYVHKNNEDAIGELWNTPDGLEFMCFYSNKKRRKSGSGYFLTETGTKAPKKVSEDFYNHFKEISQIDYHYRTNRIDDSIGDKTF